MAVNQELIEDFRSYREKMNEKLLSQNNKVISRIFNLDTNAFKAGALSARVKELLGLVSSMVLRCDDCVKYHLEQCHNLEITKEEILEVFAIANLIGGTIVIPHTRRALEFWEALDSHKQRK
jgi:AhpD family alkylhydroperoxidase